MASEATCDVGLYGLAVMGQNFALNMASKVDCIGSMKYIVIVHMPFPVDRSYRGSGSITSIETATQ